MRFEFAAANGLRSFGLIHAPKFAILAILEPAEFASQAGRGFYYGRFSVAKMPR